MTAFALTEEQQAFARRVRAIAAEELRPTAEAGPPRHVNREVRAPRAACDWFTRHLAG